MVLPESFCANEKYYLIGFVLFTGIGNNDKKEYVKIKQVQLEKSIGVFGKFVKGFFKTIKMFS